MSRILPHEPPGADPLPIGRLAPSPTGRLHLGHARTFLVAWWHARSRGGRVLLRIEDLDAQRAAPELIDGMKRDLEWLGLDWDGAAILQSARLPAFEAALRRLEDSDLVYACICSRADIRTAQTAPQLGDVEVRYPGTCRGRFPTAADAERLAHRPAGLRFRVPDETLQLHDAFAGPFSSNVAEEIGDFLVARRDGAPAYQLAVVVDDADQGVTEVVRGDDLVPSAARQYLLQRALGLPHPKWFHLPLVLDACGRRLAKRNDALSLHTLRERGIDPRSLVQWAASVSGLRVTERVSAADLVRSFSIARVSRSPVVIDDDTLGSFIA